MHRKAPVLSERGLYSALRGMQRLLHGVVGRVRLGPLRRRLCSAKTLRICTAVWRVLRARQPQHQPDRGAGRQRQRAHGTPRPWIADVDRPRTGRPAAHKEVFVVRVAVNPPAHMLPDLRLCKFPSDAGHLHSFYCQYNTGRIKKHPFHLNCTPFVRQYGILNNKRGALLCQKEYQTNDTHQNSKRL